MRLITLFLLFFLNPANIFPQTNKIALETNETGIKLLVGGEAFMVNGMNWDYFPIGTNYSYNLWDEPETLIRQALDYEMSLLKDMGVNTIRVYTGIPPQWIQYIFENYGIFTMLNHSFGRYGLSLDGEWVGNTDYADTRVRQMLLNEVKQLAEAYRDTPGLLLYLLGNENNYGLFWGGAETEDIPLADRPSTMRARPMYKLFNDAAKVMKSIDPNHPVALCNGDLLFLDIIAAECPDLDIFGTNMYRGVSFGNTFERVKNEYGKPLLITEFGADAFNTISQKEDQAAQAYYLHGNWYEIYANAAGLGNSGNSIGGFTFQFSDGWWKHGQTTNLDVHDTHASWSNGGYNHDYVSGKNNMNEEWFGVCAKGHTNEQGIYPLHPRTAYYVLREIHRLIPYATDTTLDTVKKHFEGIQVK